MFGRALGRYDLDDRALAVVESDFALAKPKDPLAWLAARGEAFGWKQLGAAPPTPTAPAGGASSAAATVTPASPPVVPVTSRATPPNSGTPTDDTPIMSMSEADKRALAARIGPIEFSKRHLAELHKNGTRVRPRLL